MQQSSIFRITLIRCFYRFIVNLCFASVASFASVVPSCIRYPDVPVCKNVQSQNQPLKTGIGFLCKTGKPVGFEPKTATTILPVQTKHQMYINNYDSWQGFGQLRSLINPRQLFLCGLFWGGNTQRVHIFYFTGSQTVVFAPQGVFCPNTALPPWAAAICCTTYRPRIWGAFSAGSAAFSATRTAAG